MKRLTVVRSSMVHAVGYDRVTRTMEVVFNDGGVFFYQGVPRSVYAALLTAPSKGHYMRESVLDVYSAIPLARATATQATRTSSRSKRARRR
jgi:hypothetical protein